MASRVIQFLWPEHQEGRVEIKTHVTVAALTDEEWETLEGVTVWLKVHRPNILTSITKTVALGGECLSLKAALEVVADQYSYQEFGEDNAILTAHGITRETLTVV